MTRAIRTVTQCPFRSGRGDATSEPSSDTGVTTPPLDPEESNDARPRSGRRVGLDVGTDRRSAGLVGWG